MKYRLPEAPKEEIRTNSDRTITTCETTTKELYQRNPFGMVGRKLLLRGGGGGGGWGGGGVGRAENLMYLHIKML